MSNPASPAKFLRSYHQRKSAVRFARKYANDHDWLVSIRTFPTALREPYEVWAEQPMPSLPVKKGEA